MQIAIKLLTWIVMKLKKSNSDQTKKKSNGDQKFKKKLKFWQKSKTQIVTKLNKATCDKTQIVTKLKL